MVNMIILGGECVTSGSVRLLTSMSIQHCVVLSSVYVCVRPGIVYRTCIHCLVQVLELWGGKLEGTVSGAPVYHGALR